MSRPILLATLLIAAPFAAFAAEDHTAEPSMLHETAAMGTEAMIDVSGTEVSPTVTMDKGAPHDHDHGMMKKTETETTGHSMKKAAH